MDGDIDLDRFMEKFDEALASLIYRTYRYNRIRSPHVPPERWEKVFANAREMETLFQMERKNDL